MTDETTAVQDDEELDEERKRDETAEATPPIVPRTSAPIQPPAPTPVIQPQATTPPPVAGPPQPQPPVGTPAPAAEVQPNSITAPTRPPTQNMTPGQVALSNLSSIDRQNPFSVLMAREKDIKNPFLRVLAKVATAGGQAIQPLSKDYAANENERIRAAAEPGEEAQRAARTQATQAETEQKEAQTARMKSGQGPLTNVHEIYDASLKPGDPGYGRAIGEEGDDQPVNIRRGCSQVPAKRPQAPQGSRDHPLGCPPALQGAAVLGPCRRQVPHLPERRV